MWAYCLNNKNKVNLCLVSAYKHNRMSIYESHDFAISDFVFYTFIRGNLGSKMGLIRKCAKIIFCELNSGTN